MTTAASALLGLALPVTGELSGTWGDTVNDSITSLLDSAVAGTTTISVDADKTLTTTTLAANEAREAIILWTAGGTVTRTITAPAQSKTYVVINKTSSTQSIKLVGDGPTTGITIVAGESCVAAWNGVDFVKIATNTVVTSFSGGTTGLTPSTDTAGEVTLSGTLDVTNGGTGLATLAAGYIPYGTGTSPFSSSVNFSYNGTTLRVGNQALLGGTTNPIVGATGSANGYIQSYIWNASNSVSSSADFVAYPNNGLDTSGWVDFGITSQTYADAAYSVTGPNESYVFGSAPAGSSTTGNLVFATDSTGTTNAMQWYVNGFTQAKGAWGMQLLTTGLQVAKGIIARVNAQTTTTSPWAWNSTNYDQQSFTALANALTINADAGSPTDGQKTIFRIKDNGTARALTWTTGTSKSFRAIGVVLPTTTVVNKTVYVGCIYNAADSRWDAVAVAQEA